MSAIGGGFNRSTQHLYLLSHRGWSREYLQAGWQLDNLSVLTRVWRVIPQSDDDNPDIRNFYGSGDLVARYETTGHYVTTVRALFGGKKKFANTGPLTPSSRAWR